MNHILGKYTVVLFDVVLYEFDNYLPVSLFIHTDRIKAHRG